MSQTKKKKLTPKQKLFCKYYVSEEFFANGVNAYAKAYDIDLSEKGAYKVAASNAYRLLINADILIHINSMLDESGLNDAFVDKQLLFLINQNADLHAKRGAIAEYNKLKARITDKLDITSKGKQLATRKDPTGFYEYMKKKRKGAK